MNYRVMIDDTFALTDRNHGYTKGEYSSHSEALAVCKEVVDRFLLYERVSGMPASALYFRYMLFGKAPSIVVDSESSHTSPGFSAWEYAKARCEELCAHPAGTSDQPGAATACPA